LLDGFQKPSRVRHNLDADGVQIKSLIHSYRQHSFCRDFFL
jgi:hypothetical protein